MIGKALEMAAWQINHATGTRGVTSELGIRAEFEQAFIDALMAQENYSEQEYDQIVNILNNIDLTLSFSERTAAARWNTQSMSGRRTALSETRSSATRRTARLRSYSRECPPLDFPRSWLRTA